MGLMLGFGRKDGESVGDWVSYILSDLCLL